MSELKNRILKDIPELVEKLRGEKARQKDYIAPQGKMQMVDTQDGVALKLDRPGEAVLLEVMEQAHAQVASKLDIPWNYYQRMLKGINDGKKKVPASFGLLAGNVNHWLGRGEGKKNLIRCIDDKVRAFLSDRYRPLWHLDLVTAGVQTITGQEPGDADRPWTKGARCFDWALSPMKLDVSFVNPCVLVNLDELDKGVQYRDPKEVKNLDGGHGWLRADDHNGDAGKPFVYPLARLRNSETGHGGLYANGGMYESVCNNAMHLGHDFAQIHIGKELNEDELWSPDTQRRINEVIFAKVRDVFRNVFNPEAFLENCKKFKGLEKVKVEDVKEAVDNIVEITGLTEDVRDEILNAYYEITFRRQNLFDVQRAVTGAAHAFREDQPEKAQALEEFGGRIIEQGREALAVK